MTSFSDIPSSVEPTPAYKFGDITKSIFKGVKAAAQKGKEERLQAVPYSSSKYEFGDFTRGVVTAALTALPLKTTSTTSSTSTTMTTTAGDSMGNLAVDASLAPDVRPHHQHVPRQLQGVLEHHRLERNGFAGGAGGADGAAVEVSIDAVDQEEGAGGADGAAVEVSVDQEERDLQEALRRSQLDGDHSITRSFSGSVVRGSAPLGVRASSSVSGDGASAPPVVHMNGIDLSGSTLLATQSTLLPPFASSAAASSSAASSSSSSASAPSSAAAVFQGADESLLCLVCMDQPKTMAFHPCGHMCLCTGN